MTTDNSIDSARGDEGKKAPDNKKSTAKRPAQGAKLVTGFTRFASARSLNTSDDITITQFIHDKRFGSVYAEEILGEHINLEFIARGLTEPETKHQVVEALLSGILGRSFVAAAGAGRIKVGERVLSRYTIAEAVQHTLGAKASDKVRVILSELLIHIITPLKLFDPIESPDDRVNQVTRHDAISPTFDEWMADIMMRELRSRLDTLSPLDVSDSMRFATAVMARSIDAHGRAVARSLAVVHETRALIIDTLKIVRARVESAAWTEHVGLVGGIPTQLVNHDAIDAFARIYDIVQYSMDPQVVQDLRLVTDASILLAELDRVYAAVRNSQRYELVSIGEDFKQRFTKTTVRDIDQKPQIGILSHNEIGSNSVQAVIAGDSVAGINGRYLMPAPATEAYLSGLYGDLLKAIATTQIHETAFSVFEHAVITGDFKEKGVYSLNTSFFGGQVASVNNLLAIACAKRVVIARDHENRLMLAYAVDVSDVAYEPVSGSRVTDEIILTDPLEVVMLARDWNGTRFLADRQQVLPTQAVNSTVRDGMHEFYAPINKRVSFEHHVADSQFKVMFSVAHRGGLRDETRALVVPPMINRRVAAVMEFTLRDLLTYAGTIEDRAVRIGVKQRVFARVFSMIASLPAGRIDSLASDIIEQYATEASVTGADRIVFKSNLQRGIAYKRMRVQIADMILRRLCLVEDPVSGSSLLRTIVADEDFDMYTFSK